MQKNQGLILAIKVLAIAMILFSVQCKSVIKVQSPLALKEFFQAKYNITNGSIPFSLANYGDIPYGKTISGKIALPEILENCVAEDLDIQSNKTGTFIISERQDCSFTQKSLNAQLQGAKMSIIIDNVDNQNPERIIMIQDGRGKQVHIPTVLISKTDGQKIVETITSKFEVVITITFETNKTKKADMNLWLDSSSRASYIFVRKFRPYFEKISQFVNLVVRYDTYPCTYCPEAYCYGNTSYCKDNFRVWGLANLGQEIIKQQLRQQYIYQNSKDLWWQYMSNYDDYCANWAQSFDCSLRIMKNLGIQSRKINQLVLNTVNSIQSYRNTTKKQQYEAAIINNTLKINEKNKLAQNIKFLPSVVVNNIVYRGNMDSYDVFQILCNSIDPMPNGCSQFKDPTTPNHGNFWIWIIVGINIFFGFLLFLVIVYRRIVRRQLSKDMNSQVNQLVNQYISMYENERFERKN